MGNWTPIKNDVELGDFLGEPGCRATDTPYVVRGLLQRMRSFYNQTMGGRPYRVPLASAFLDSKCNGTHSFGADEIAALSEIQNASPAPLGSSGSNK